MITPPVVVTSISICVCTCAVGKHQAMVGQATCLECEAGHVSNQLGNVNCVRIYTYIYIYIYIYKGISRGAIRGY